jgi:hypothetical protein
MYFLVGTNTLASLHGGRQIGDWMDGLRRAWDGKFK